MRKQAFRISPKIVSFAVIVVAIGAIVGTASYFLAMKPEETQAPIIIDGSGKGNEERDAAENVIKSYLEDLKIKNKEELASYFSSDAKNIAMDLAGYYDNKNVSLDSFEILKIEKTGDQEFSFQVREFQKDRKYGEVGYFDNKYRLIKTEETYVLGSIEMGGYMDTGETRNWKIVRNLEKGYEIRYPENFFYEEPEISVSTIAGSSSLEGCYARNFKGFIVRKVSIGGSEYCLSESTEASAGSTYVDSSYTNVEKNRIATLHFIARYPDCRALGGVGEVAYTKCEDDNKKGPATVERVVSTFKFLEIQQP